MKVLKAIYTFLVGDLIILVGVSLIVTLLLLLNTLSLLTPLHMLSGGILIIAILAVLVTSLAREAFAKR